MLYEFIEIHREEIIRRCRAKVAARSIPPPTAAEIDHGVPLFLDQLVGSLRSGGAERDPEIAKGARLHGHDLLVRGFTVSQVVHDYGDICQAVTELAMELAAPIAADDFRTLNRCLDDAIASAVTEFGRTPRSARGEEKDRERQRSGFFTHELRNLVNTATVAFGVLKTGNVGVGGSTAAIVDRSLSGLRALIERSMAEVRLTEGIQNIERIMMPDFVGEVAAGTTLEAEARGIRFVTAPVELGLAIEVDKQVLEAVVTNLLQNALKFTRPGTTVTLSVEARADRVLIHVQDECGGLPGGDANTAGLFRMFEQRGSDRSGVGVGLAFSRWGTEANNGRLYARNKDNGCVFTVDLPRSDVPAPMTPGPALRH